MELVLKRQLFALNYAAGHMLMERRHRERRIPVHPYIYGYFMVRAGIIGDPYPLPTKFRRPLSSWLVTRGLERAVRNIMHYHSAL